MSRAGLLEDELWALLTLAPDANDGDVAAARRAAEARRVAELERLQALRQDAEARIPSWEESWRRFWVDDAAHARFVEYRDALRAAERRAAALEAARTTTTPVPVATPTTRPTPTTSTPPRTASPTRSTRRSPRTSSARCWLLFINK